MVRALRFSISDTCTGLYCGMRVSLFKDDQHCLSHLRCPSELAVIVDAVELSLFWACLCGSIRLSGVLFGTMADASEVTDNADSGVVDTGLLLCR